MKTSGISITVFLALTAVLASVSGARFITNRSDRTSSVSRHRQSYGEHGSESCLRGLVEDCCCDYATVNSINIQVLYPLLEPLVRTPFFRFFKVKLEGECPFWPTNGISGPDNQSFRKGDGAFISNEDKSMFSLVMDKKLDMLGDLSLNSWISRDNPWTWDDERDYKDVICVDLLMNPERHTGYSARRIWDAIYTENVLKCEKDAPVEKRVLYQLISGMHSSISVHISARYLVDECKHIYGRNLTVLDNRVLKHPDRIQNLYFTFLVVLRAVDKASDYLLDLDYNTGNPVIDMKTKTLVKELVENDQLRAACPIPFDEAKLWQGRDGHELLKQMQAQFRNVTALMNCVGCERCRLWAKLQFLGLGTALDILFNENTKKLDRNEVVALVNLLDCLSESINYLHKFGHVVQERPPLCTLDPLKINKQ